MAFMARPGILAGILAGKDELNELPLQGAPGAAQQRFDGSYADLQDVCDLLVGHAVELAQQQRAALAFWKFGDRRPDGPATLLLLECMVRCAAQAGWLVPYVRLGGSVGSERAVLSIAIDAQVVTDAKQPRTETGACWPPSPGVLPDAQEGFLTQVIHIRQIAVHAIQIAVQRPNMPIHEALERGTVPGLNPGHEFFVSVFLFI